MYSNSIQENYSNVLDYLAKTLSIFKCHVDYSQKLTEDCTSLFQLGQHLQRDYENLLFNESTLYNEENYTDTDNNNLYEKSFGLSSPLQ